MAASAEEVRALKATVQSLLDSSTELQDKASRAVASANAGTIALTCERDLLLTEVDTLKVPSSVLSFSTAMLSHVPLCTPLALVRGLGVYISSKGLAFATLFLRLAVPCRAVHGGGNVTAAAARLLCRVQSEIASVRADLQRELSTNSQLNQTILRLSARIALLEVNAIDSQDQVAAAAAIANAATSSMSLSSPASATGSAFSSVPLPGSPSTSATSPSGRRSTLAMSSPAVTAIGKTSPSSRKRIRGGRMGGEGWD